MGKRKSSAKKPQGPKKREPLPSTFQCLFCNHEDSVSVKLDKKAGTGEISCKICGQQFQTGINYLSVSVDVYYDWVDACSVVAKIAADPAEDGQVTDPYHDLATVGGRSSSHGRFDQHLVAPPEGNDDNQGDYGEN